MVLEVSESFECFGSILLDFDAKESAVVWKVVEDCCFFFVGFLYAGCCGVRNECFGLLLGILWILEGVVLGCAGLFFGGKRVLSLFFVGMLILSLFLWNSLLDGAEKSSY